MVNEIFYVKYGQHPSSDVTFAHQQVIKYIMYDNENAFAGIVFI